jgi:hypothetical protein
MLPLVEMEGPAHGRESRDEGKPFPEKEEGGIRPVKLLKGILKC